MPRLAALGGMHWKPASHGLVVFMGEALGALGELAGELGESTGEKYCQQCAGRLPDGICGRVSRIWSPLMHWEPCLLCSQPLPALLALLA